MRIKKRTRATFGVFAFVLAAISLGAASFAWLSSNRDLDSDNMQMQVDITANLVISDLSSTPFDAKAVSVTLTSKARPLLPAMHSGSAAGKTNLVTVPGTVNIDKATGLGASGALGAGDYVEVPVAADSRFYIDYDIYVAADGKALENAALTARLGYVMDSTLPEYHKATSVDFYLDGAYKGTLNLAELDIAANHNGYNGSATKNSVELLTDGRIPCLQDTSGTGYSKITMRCYFDGELHDSATTTFVRTAQLDTGTIGLNVFLVAVGTEVNHN